MKKTITILFAVIVTVAASAQDTALTYPATYVETVLDAATLQSLGEHAYQMAYRDSARVIAQEVLKLAEKK